MYEIVRSPLYVVYGLRIKGTIEYRYIGLTTKPLVERYYKHLWNARKESPKYPVHKWLKKYTDDVEICVIESLYSEDRYLLGEREVFWIKVFRGLGHRLLNMDDGGFGGLNKSMPEGWGKSQSERMTGVGNPMYGKTFTDEHRKNISEGLKGKSSWAKGKSFSEEHRKNISIGHADVSGKNNPMYGVPSPMTGKVVSNTTKEKMREARLGNAYAPHIRWHVNRSIKNPSCTYCLGDKE